MPTDTTKKTADRANRPRRAVKRTAGRPKLEDVAEIERVLFSVALKEFVDKGYGGSSLTKIVKAAGISKTTLYSRFESKDKLFHAIMQAEIRRLDAATILNPEGRLPKLIDGLKAYANHMLELNLQGDLLSVNRLISSESHRFPVLASAAAERAEMGIKRITGFIQECSKVEKKSCKDPAAVAEAFIYMIRGWHANAMLINQKPSVAQREKWVERMVRTLVSARDDW